MTKHAEYFLERATEHHNAKRYDKAMTGYDRAIALDPACAPAIGNRAELFLREGRYAEAIRDLQAALAIMPEAVGGWINLGNALQFQGYYENALECMENALRLDNKDPLAWHGRCNVLREMGGHDDEARRCCEMALKLKPDLAEARGTLAYLKLRAGEWTDGWNDYEYRVKAEDFIHITLPKPKWKGDTTVKNLVLTTEQGLGDAIMMARFAPWLAEFGIKVYILAWPKLVELFQFSMPSIKVTMNPKDLPAEYEWCSLMSVPGVLGVTPEWIPGKVPYLLASWEKRNHWLDWLIHHEPEKRPIRIGLVWQPGHPKLHGFTHRDIPLEAFKPLSTIPGVRLYSLQKGPGAVEVQSQTVSFPVTDIPGRDMDRKAGFFFDTAACMMNMDFIVSTDTSTVHLAGALGCRTFMPSPTGNCWRWLLDREDSPWYPSLSIIRQTIPKKWDGVFETIAERIKNECR